MPGAGKLAAFGELLERRGIGWDEARLRGRRLSRPAGAAPGRAAGRGGERGAGGEGRRHVRHPGAPAGTARCASSSRRCSRRAGEWPELLERYFIGAGGRACRLTAAELVARGRRVIRARGRGDRAPPSRRLDDAVRRGPSGCSPTRRAGSSSPGVGKSGLIARKIAATLTSTGTPATFLHPVDSCTATSGSSAGRRGDRAQQERRVGGAARAARVAAAAGRADHRHHRRAGLHARAGGDRGARRRGGGGGLSRTISRRRRAPRPPSRWATRSPWRCSRRRDSGARTSPRCIRAARWAGSCCSGCATSWSIRDTCSPRTRPCGTRWSAWRTTAAWRWWWTADASPACSRPATLPAWPRAIRAFSIGRWMEIMTRTPRTAGPDELAAAAVGTMERHGVDRPAGGGCGRRRRSARCICTT